MDIRNWFSTSPKVSVGAKNQLAKQETAKRKNPEKEVKKNKRRIVDSDSDDEAAVQKTKPSATGSKRKSPEGKASVVKKPKTAPLQKKKSALSSDDECAIVDSGSQPERRSPRKQAKPIHIKPEDSKPILVSDFFGAAPIERSSKGATQKAAPVAKKLEESHGNEAFLDTLQQLDGFRNKDLAKKDHSKRTTPSEEVKERKPSPKKKAPKKPQLDIEIIPAPLVEKKTTVIKAPEKKPAPKRNSGNYFSYLNRQGPSALGSKEIPVGEEECLKGKTFLITGILESIERDEAKELIEKYGGKVMTTLSKNTNYMITGRDAGSSKLDKAVKLGTVQLDEDGFLDLIRTTPGNGVKKESPPIVPKSESPNQFKNFKTSPAKDCIVPSEKFDKAAMDEPARSSELSVVAQGPKSPVFEMWVDKYKPVSLKKVIGQQGPNSNANKLLSWLSNWWKHTKSKKPPAGRWGANNDGSGFRAALLSGPPGVGKTTTAQLVCKELGFDYFELNASDTRSKKSLQSMVSELLLNKSLFSCFKGNTKGIVTNNHVVIMDEVDGMAGNEDRGGIQELIGFIKASKIPIICICNDRNHPKIRSLSNYCFDLRFQKPRVDQIKSAMMSVAFKEGLQVTPNILQDIITASNQDIRQVLHNLSVWYSSNKGLSGDQVKKDIGKGTKHVKMNPFDVLREVFTIGNNKNATINDKSDLFFHDYSIAPLFVQENYVHVIPSAAGGDKQKHLKLLSEAADSICMGDLIDKQIRSRSSWSLLPVQAIHASVIPGELLAGNLRQMVNFPTWLGKNSNRNHMDRLSQELQTHMRMRITGNKTDVVLDYLPVLKPALTRPLVEKGTDGVKDVLNIMNSYFLTREDFDSVLDLSLWSNMKDPRSEISAKVKSAFTRAYNKQARQNPFAVVGAPKKKKGSAQDDLLGGEGDEGEIASDDEATEEDDIANNAMIKVKKQTTGKAKASEAASSSKNVKPTAKKGRGKK